MRVSNNNQTTFGMNPALKLEGASAKLANRVMRNKDAIVNIGSHVSVCMVQNYEKHGAHVIVQVAKDGEVYEGIAYGPARKIVRLVESANSMLNEVLADAFLELKTIL